MGKVSSVLKNSFSSLRRCILRFPVSTMSIFASFIAFAFAILFDIQSENVINFAISFLSGAFFSCAVTLGFELFDKASKSAKVLSCVIGILPGIIMYICSFIISRRMFELTLAGVYIASILLCVYFLTSGGKVLLAVPHILRCSFFAGIISLLVLIGGLICIGAFIMLVYEFPDFGKAFLLLFDFCALLFNIIFLSSLNKPGEHIEEPKKFMRTTILYVELVIYFILLGVLYIYLIKTLSSLSIPTGSVNPYVTIASAIFIFNLYAVGTFESSSKIAKFFMKFGGYIMLPLVILQIISLGIRISYHGLTSLRVFSIFFIITTLLFILGSIFTKRFGLGKPLILSAIITLALTVTPFNFISIPIMQQTSMLKNLLTEHGMYKNEILIQNENLDQESKKQILSCYNYLRRYSDNAPDFLENYNWENAYELFGFESYYYRPYAQENHEYCSYYNNSFENPFDISAYKTIGSVNEYFVNADEITLNLYYPDGTKLSFDGNSIPIYFYEKYGTSFHDIDNQGIINITDECDFLFKEVQFHYRQSDGLLSEVFISGYLLLK